MVTPIVKSNMTQRHSSTAANINNGHSPHQQFWTTKNSIAVSKYTSKTQNFRQLYNQRGENVGFTTSVGKQNSYKPVKVREKRLKKTVDLIGDFFSNRNSLEYEASLERKHY